MGASGPLGRTILIRARKFAVAVATAATLAGAVPGLAAEAAAPESEAAVAFGAIPKSWSLKGVVIFSRHGIRGPLDPAKCDNADPAGACMDAIASEPWPTYGVIAQNLIPDGYARVATLGRYYRELYAAEGVVPAKGCPTATAATFVTDTTERTVITAGALADGMFPGCSPPFSIEPQVYTGPTCGFDASKADAASQALIGGSWAAVAAGELRRPLAVMNAVLGPFKPAGCTANGGSAPCSLSTLPISASNPGPIHTADQPSEQFLMQYAAGLPAKEVAWGKLPGASGRPLPQAITLVNAVHALRFRGDYMPRYQAVKQGSQVMHRVFASLNDIARGKGAPLQVYAGHDNNIINMAGLLGLKWQLDSYQPYQVPPGGAVAFELWQPPAGEAAVRLVYFAQTIEQMRRNTRLSLDRPPATAVMPVAGCASQHGACPWSAFSRIVTKAVDPACVRPAKG